VWELPLVVMEAIVMIGNRCLGGTDVMGATFRCEETGVTETC
jgi:hypothetical protein